MKRTLTWSAALVIGLTSAAHADVTGHVKLDGPPPDLGTIDMSGQKQCAALHPDPVEDPSVVVGEGGQLKNVVVSIQLGDDQEVPNQPPAPKTPVVLDQKGCMFEPHVLAMRSGQKLVVQNSDPFLHNVHAQCSANEAFNMAMPTANKGEAVDPQPKVPETFKVKCDVHPWMSAWVAVFDHPYFAVTADDGTFDIKGLPDGTYTLKAWHERYGVQTTKITVKDGKATADFAYKSTVKK